MIHYIFGKLGGGKGLVLMRQIALELAFGYRDVVTNFPLKLDPWVNGAGEAQMGLVAFLQKTYGSDFDVRKRVKVVDDLAESSALFLYRRDPETSEWFKLPMVLEEGKAVRFDAEPVKEVKCQPVLIATDEAWQFYPAREFSKTAPIVQFYARQNRKFRDEWFIVSQSVKDVDVALQRICQDFTRCRNHAMEKMFIFRQPSVFHTTVYNDPQCQMKQGEAYFKLDIKGLAQCYDTSAGVGIAGGMAADRGEKKKGLHWAWLLAAIVLAGALLITFAFSGGRLFRSYARHSVRETSKEALGLVHTNAPALPAAKPARPAPWEPHLVSAAGLRVEASDQAAVRITALVPDFTAKTMCFYLSDGQKMLVNDPRVRQWGKDFLVLKDGSTFLMSPLSVQNK